MSQEKIFHLKALGAEVQLTRSDVTKGHAGTAAEVGDAAEKGAAGGLHGQKSCATRSGK